MRGRRTLSHPGLRGQPRAESRRKADRVSVYWGVLCVCPWSRDLTDNWGWTLLKNVSPAMSLRQVCPGAAGACRSSPKPRPAGLRSSTYWLKVLASLNLTLPCECTHPRV